VLCNVAWRVSKGELFSILKLLAVHLCSTIKYNNNNNNNGGIMDNNYGANEGLISHLRTPVGKRKYFFQFYSHFGQGPL